MCQHDCTFIAASCQVLHLQVTVQPCCHLLLAYQSHDQKLPELCQADRHGLLQTIPNVPPHKEGVNPATWMLEISTPGQEKRIGVDFSAYYEESEQAR